MTARTAICPRTADVETSSASASPTWTTVSTTPAATASNHNIVADRAVSGGSTRLIVLMLPAWPRRPAGSGVLRPHSGWRYIHQTRRMPARRGRGLEVRAVLVEPTAHGGQLDRRRLHRLVQPVHADPHDPVPRLQRLSRIP